MTKTKISNSSHVILRKKKMKNGYSLFLDIHFKNNRKKEYLQLYLSDNKKLNDLDKDTLKLAERIKTRRILELQAEYHHEHDFKPKNNNFYDFLDDKIQNSPQLRPNSIKKMIALKQQLNIIHKGPLRFDDFTDSWIEEFRNFLVAKFKQSTADRYFSQLKTTLNQAAKAKVIPVNPMQFSQRIGRSKSLPKFLSFEELMILKDTPLENENLKLAFFFSCMTSLRISDIKMLKWKNLIYKNGLPYLHFIQLKTGGEELNPISTEALNFLPAKRKPDDLIFELPINSVIDKSLKRWAKRAGLTKNLSFHVARHTFGTLAHSSGIDLLTLSKLMGHSDVKVTQVYARVTDKIKEEAVTKLPKL